MNTYTIILGTTNPIVTVSGTEYAYEVYKKTRELGELLGKSVYLILDDNAGIVAYYDPEEEPDYCEPIEIDFIKKDLKVLKKIKLEEKLQRAKEKVEWFKTVKDDKGMVMMDKLDKYIAECEEIQKEIDNL